MGISDTTNRRVLQGDGSSTIFVFPDPFTQASDLSVFLFDTNSSVIYPQTLNTNYTVSGAQNAQGWFPQGGNVVMNSAVISTWQVVVTRAPSQVQRYVLMQNQPIDAIGLVQELDYLTLLVQRHTDQLNRAILLPDGVGNVGSVAYSGALPPGTTALGNANAPLILNSGANGWQFGVVASNNSSVVSYFGILPVANGGTGQGSFLVPGEIIYAVSSSGMGITTGGTIGQALTYQGGSSAPSWQAFLQGSGFTAEGVIYASGTTSVASTQAGGLNIPLLGAGTTSPPLFQALPLASSSVSGTLTLPYGGTGMNSAVGGRALFTSNSGAIGESGIKIVGSGALFGSATAAAPSVSFINDTRTGMFQSSASELTFVANGVPALDLFYVTSSQVNVGMGTPASSLSSVPFTSVTAQNAQAYWQFTNTGSNTGANATIILTAGASNYMTIENQYYNAAAYLGGTGLLSAGTNLLGLVLAGEYASSYIAFDVGGRTPATEWMRLTPRQLTLNQGTMLTFTSGSGLSTIQIHAASSLTSHAYVLPTAQGGASTFLQNDGSGNLSWNTATGSSSVLTTVTKTAAYTMLSSDDVVYVNSSNFTIGLPDATTTTKKIYRIMNVGSGAVLFGGVTIQASGSQTIGSYGNTVQIWTPNESWHLITDGANFQVEDHKCEVGPTQYVPNYQGITLPSENFHSWIRRGNMLRGWGNFVAPSKSASTALITLPINLTINSSAILLLNSSGSKGQMFGKVISAANSALANLVTAPLTSNSSLYFCAVYSTATAGNQFVPIPGNSTDTVISAGATQVEYEVPIAGWYP